MYIPKRQILVTSDIEFYDKFNDFCEKTGQTKKNIVLKGISLVMSAESPGDDSLGLVMLNGKRSYVPIEIAEEIQTMVDENDGLRQYKRQAENYLQRLIDKKRYMEQEKNIEGRDYRQLCEAISWYTEKVAHAQ